MKNIYSFVLCIALVGLAVMGLTACDDDSPEAPAGSLSVSPEALEFPLGGDVKTLVVTGTGWTATPSADWIGLDPQGDALIVTVGESDTPRDGSITVANAYDSVTVPVSQAADGNAIIVTPDRMEFAATAASQTVTVRSSLTWAVTSDQTWLTVTKTGADAFVASVEAWDGGETRHATITIDNGETTRDVPVTQEGALGIGMPVASAYHYFDTETSTTLLFNMSNAMQPEPPHLFDGTGYYLCFNLTMPLVSYDNPTLEIAPGKYTFTQGGDLGADFSATLTMNRIEQGAQGAAIPYKQGTLEVSGDHTGYLMKVAVELGDGTVFRAYYEGPMNIKNPRVLTQLWDDYELLPLTHGNIGFRGDVIGNGTYAWAVELFSEGIYEEDGYMKGDGNHVQLMLVSDQSGDGTVMPNGKYTLLDLEEDDYGAFQAVAGFGEWGYGSWINEMTDGWIMGAGLAPLYKGTVASVYDPVARTYTLTIDAEDDAHNRITGTFSGALEWWKVPEIPVEVMQVPVPVRVRPQHVR